MPCRLPSTVRGAFFAGLSSRNVVDQAAQVIRTRPVRVPSEMALLLGSIAGNIFCQSRASRHGRRAPIEDDVGATGIEVGVYLTMSPLLNSKQRTGHRPTGQSGTNEHRIKQGEGSKESQQLTYGFPYSCSDLSFLLLALYFSLLSATRIGCWITRIQPRQYSLQATGWVRVVSGVQSLISVYLVALAILTYFGTPFEY